MKCTKVINQNLYLMFMKSEIANKNLHYLNRFFFKNDDY